MECAKPKSRKKKKVKNSNSETKDESLSSLEEFDVDLNELKELCTEMKSDSPEIETLEVSYAQESDDITNTNFSEIKAVVKENVFEDCVAPSAPIEEIPEPNIFSFPLKIENQTLYPDLKLVEQPANHEKILSPMAMKPFTKAELECLYSNHQIKHVEIFEEEFNQRELKDSSLQEHFLYVLLKRYTKARSRFLKNSNDAENVMRKLEDNYKNIWKVQSKVASAHGFCACGRVLRATHTYNYALFSEEIYGELDLNMKKLQMFTSHNHIKFLQESILCHRQIEQLINHLMNDSAFKHITNESPITLNPKTDNQNMQIKINELRTYISVLFKFFREMPQDKIVQTDVKGWIKQLVSLQLRIATWEDHVFILFHILRCRDGVGNWASCLVQIPSVIDSITNYDLLSMPDFHHCIAVLHIILMPISKRQIFLEEYLKDVIASKNKSEKDLWILVDSDGEGGSSSSEDYSKLKENDLVQLFDQISFELIFKSMSFAYKNDENYVLDVEKLSFGHNVIKIIAFCSKFISIIRNGLVSITDRHRQFAKRLGKLIKETLLYLRDIISIYNSSQGYKDPEQYQRIQLEFDEQIIRSTWYIYECNKLSLFQYLADFPYELLSIKATWKLFFCLHTGGFSSQEEDSSSMKFDLDFIEKFNHDIAMDDMLFLLHTFSKMALCKGDADKEFLSFVMKDLIHIGFINDFTRDYCYNTVKGLVVDITAKYSELVGETITYIKNNLQAIGSLSTYLLKSLPIEKWKPTQKDLELFSSWLLNYDFDRIESSTARFIIASINWNFDESNQLFLPHEIHVRMAHLICEVYLKYVCESNKTEFNETKFIGKITKASTKKDKFSVWCWSMISLLRLHQMDINPISIMKNSNLLNIIPEFEELNIVYQGAIDNKPLPIYISFLISQYSHSIPQICHKGFDQLKSLLLDHRYPKVIRCLELITPLFLNCIESLHQCESFLSILDSLVKADKINGITEKDHKCTVLKLLGNMILNQLNSYQKYSLISPFDIAFLWLNSFLKLKNWNKDERIVWILDQICQFAYPFSDVWHMIKETLRSFVQTIAVTKLQKSSGLFSFVMSEEADVLYVPFDDAPTLSMLILECEHENIELNTGYWNDLIYQLSVQKDLTLENIHKSILQTKQLTYFPLKSLVIFKVAKLICNCSMESFIFPILCQQFFILYFSRVFIDITNDSRGVQEKFYDQDVALMKKLKRKFEESEMFHSDIATNENGDASQYHTNLSKIFKTFLLWLEENQLNSMMQKNIILPPLYESQKLKQIFQGNKAHWTEYINIQQLRNDQKKSCESWMKFCMRHGPQNVDLASSEEQKVESQEIIVQRICNRLKQSEKTSQPPPELVRKAVYMGKIDLSKDTLRLFRDETKILKKSAHQYSLTLNEHKAIDAVYRDSIRHAYINESTFRMKMATCSKLLDNCQGSLALRVEFCEMKANEGIRSKLEDNREYHRKLIFKELKDCDQKITDANFCVQNILHQLIELYSTDLSKRENILKLMKTLFYELLADIDTEILEYPITNEFYSNSITTLGSFIQQYDNTEMLGILKLALQRPLIMNLFTEIFAPSNAPPNVFISLYECLVNMYGKNYEPHTLFVLVSKFDMPTFLQSHRPKLVEVSELIKLIFRGLELWTIENSELLQDAFRCHLVHLFMYRFPEHYGEVLQCILTEFAQQKLRPCILFDIVNAFYQRIGCSKMDSEMSIGRMKDEMRIFASKQNLLQYNDLHSTALMLNHFFYNERLQHGLHGIYPKFSKYCDVLTILFGTIGHGVVSSAIKAFPDASADYLVSELYPCISNMYAPMLVPLYYSQNNMKDTPANWIQQLSSGNTILQPWSNVQTENAEKFIRTYAMCLQYMFDMLPSSNMLIQHLFTWYLEYFAHKSTPKHVLSPIQLLLTKMPFERLLPTLQHLEGINRVLMDFAPDCHTFLGNIFLRIPWSQWLSVQFQTMDFGIMQRIMSILLMTTIKLSYEPKVRESIRILQLLQDSVKYPWNTLDYKDVENALDWFVMSAEPSMILKIPSEHELVDQNVHILLQTVACMRMQQKDSQQQTVVTAKRMAYVRSIVRIFKSCDAKLHQLVSTPKGQQMFNEAFKEFLSLIDNCVQDEIEATNLVMTITDKISVPESVANLFSSGIQTWQDEANVGSLTLCCFLNALKVQQIWTLQIFKILDSTLKNYMRTSDLNPEHKPSWIDAIERLPLNTDFDFKILIEAELYMAVHLASINKITQLTNDEDRMELLIDLQTKLSSQKTTETTEPGYCLIWSFLLMSYQHMLQRSEQPKKQLRIIAKYLQTTYNQTEGWGDGILGAIGLKKDPETNEKKILMRCLACATFGLLLPDTEFESSVDAFKNFLNQKRFVDLKMRGLQAISLIENKKTTMSDDFKDVISKVMKIFYTNSFLNQVEKLYYW